MWPESQVHVVGESAPKTWADYRKGCLSTYGGGHHGKEVEAFQHGMETVFNLLEAEFPPAEQCKAVPALIAACENCLATLLIMQQPKIAPGVASNAELARIASEGLRESLAKAKPKE
jgi:hypothetical protein